MIALAAAGTVLKAVSARGAALAGKVPAKAWLIAGALFAGVLLYFWHGSKVRELEATAFHKGEEAAAYRIQAQAIIIRNKAEAVRRKAEAKAVQITGEIDRVHAQGTADIRARADALRVRGPRKAIADSRVHGGPVPGVPGTAGVADAAADQYYVRVGWYDLVREGTNCAIDAKTLTDLQDWVRAQARASEERVK